MSAAKAEALALRVAELSTVLKQQRAELDEKNALLEHHRKIVKDHEEVIRTQEGQGWGGGLLPGRDSMSYQS